MTVPFWSNDPAILLDKEFVFELWPTQFMSHEQKLNSISRLVIVLSLLGYMVTTTLRILIIGVVTLIAIYMLFATKTKQVEEGFAGKNDPVNSKIKTNISDLQSVLKSEFKEGTKKNPFSNVLLTQIADDPERKAAPPAFNVEVDETITKNVKRAVQTLNPEIKNTDKQLYSSLWDKFELDQSNRAFYSTANTRVANDQGAYAQFLYSDLKYSGKESTADGAIARVQDNHRYTMY
jgi:hypothetical protein